MPRAILIAATLASTAAAHADDRRVEREHFATPHWVYDDRFHHNHYYPARGDVVDVLPPATSWRRRPV